MFLVVFFGHLYSNDAVLYLSLDLSSVFLLGLPISDRISIYCSKIQKFPMFVFSNWLL